MTRSVAILSVCGLVTACAPDLRSAPLDAAIDVPGRWADPMVLEGHVDPEWWRGFQDPVLDRLEQRALAGNVDILVAIARIEEAQANTDLARSQARPSINASLGVKRSRSLLLGRTIEATTVEPQGLFDWQLDLFGRYRDQTRAAALQALATSADRDGLRLSVAGQVAQAYIGLLALDAQLTVTRQTLTARATQLAIQRDRTTSGYDSQFELTQAQSDYDAVLQSVPGLERRVRQQELALTLLLGETPGASIERGDIRQLATPVVPGSLPSSLLRRRPDLAAGELRVASADATMAARRAEFLPNVDLSASGGALLVNTLNYDPVTVWSIGASLLQPIFAGGRLTAQVDQATARRDQAAYDYKRLVLSAFQDVLSGLTAVGRFDEQVAVARSRRDTLIRSVVLANDRYDNGYSSNLDRLDAERNLYAVELTAIDLHRDQLNNLVQLAVAFGGGWTPARLNNGADGLPERGGPLRTGPGRPDPRLSQNTGDQR